MPEEEKEAEISEYTITFLDALARLQATWKYMHKFDTEGNITVMCNKVKN